MKNVLLGRSETTFNPDNQELNDFIFDPKRTHDYIENEEDTEELPWLWTPVPPGEEDEFEKNYIPEKRYMPDYYPTFTHSEEDSGLPKPKPRIPKATPRTYVVMNETEREEESASYEQGIKALREVEEAREVVKEWAVENIPRYEEYNYYTPLGEDRTLFKVGDSFVEELFGGSVLVEKTGSYVSLAEESEQEKVDPENIRAQIRELATSKEIPLSVKLELIDRLYEDFMNA